MLASRKAQEFKQLTHLHASFLCFSFGRGTFKPGNTYLNYIDTDISGNISKVEFRWNKHLGHVHQGCMGAEEVIIISGGDGNVWVYSLIVFCSVALGKKKKKKKEIEKSYCADNHFLTFFSHCQVCILWPWIRAAEHMADPDALLGLGDKRHGTGYRKPCYFSQTFEAPPAQIENLYFLIQNLYFKISVVRLYPNRGATLPFLPEEHHFSNSSKRLLRSWNCVPGCIVSSEKRMHHRLPPVK